MISKLLLNLCVLSFMLTSSLVVTGCGIKPNTLKAPENASESQYPKTYPAKK